MQNIDFEILSGIKVSDKESFNLLFEVYYEKLCNYAASIMLNHDNAEDIVQDLFATIWIERKTLAIKTSLNSYLYRAVYNASLDYLKHDKVKDRYQKMNTENAQVTYDQSIEFMELVNNLEKSIERLPDQCKTIFRLSRFENLKYREIADKLNISENTVDTQIRRALKKLKEDLKNYLRTTLFILIQLF